MQSYSHPDVFFCPLYNPPGVSDPIASILSGESEHWNPSPSCTPPSSRSASPSASASSPSSTPVSSRETSPSPPTSPSSASSSSSTSSEGSKKLQKYRRMCAKSGKPLLDFVAEVEGRRIVHEKRKQIKTSQSTRNSPVRPGSGRY
ncbi:hypothetical protein GY45DRAFT_1336445 [Cubamyces sp. BRFM 1775]|nr:hypothetical protein GY45DRAFT_1336445 [Cubamyces sp. BRFM 1775]